MTGFTDKLKDALPGKHGKSTTTKKSESHSTESHTSTVTPAHPTLLPSESAAQPQALGGGYGRTETSQAPTSFAPTSGGFNSDSESYEHVSAPKDHRQATAGVTPSGPVTPQLSPRLPKESLTSSGPSAAPQGVQYESSEQRAPGSGIGPDVSARLAASNTAPGGPTYEPSAFGSRTQEQGVPASGISHDSRLAGSARGAAFEPQTHSAGSVGQQKVASASPSVTDVGISPGLGSSGGNRSSEADKVSIGGGGVNANTTPTSTPATGLTGSQPQGYVQQAKDTAAPYVAKAQETAAPYVAKVQETAGPYVAKVQETAGPYVAQAQETVGPYVAKAQEVASPYVAKARDLGGSAVESARPVVAQAANTASQAASSAYNTAAAELDARGVNLENTKQKLADAGQAAKDYGTVGQQRAGEYFQQAVDQVKNTDRENKSIVATIFGTVVLVWLAFGFSLVAMLSLGVAGTIAALLARFSSKRVSGNAPGRATQPTHTQATVKQTNIPGVETHYPKPSHPDNSLNNAAS